MRFSSDRQFAEKAKLFDVRWYADRCRMVCVAPAGGVGSWWFDSPVDPSVKMETFVAGEFIKSGRGTLVIAADSETVVNDFSGGITVNAGVLALAGPITSNIAGVVVFTGGELAVEQSVVTTMNDWTTLLRAESFAGLGEQAGKLMLRIIDGNAGEKLLQGRYQRSGGVVIIR